MKRSRDDEEVPPTQLPEEGVQDDDNDVETQARERRELRTALRGNLDTIRREKGEMVRGKARGRHTALQLNQTQETLFKHVKHTREMVLDAEAEAALGKIICEQAVGVEVNTVTDTPMDWALKVRSFLQRHDGNAAADDENNNNDNNNEVRAFGPQGWVALARLAGPFFSVAPGFDYLYGAAQTGPAERKERKPREAQAPVEQEKVVADLHEGEEEQLAASTATMKRVDELDKVVRGVRTVPVWKLIANPNSLSQTVERMFHLSFLVQKGQARILNDPAGGPVVKPAEPPSGGENHETERTQAVVRVDAAALRKAAQFYNIKKPLIAPTTTATAKSDAGSAKSKAPLEPTPIVSPVMDPTQAVESQRQEMTPVASGRKKKQKQDF